MRHRGSHLTYCTNIHPGQTWPEIRTALSTHVKQVKERVSPDAPFGVGLRLSQVAAEQLLAGAIDELTALLDALGMYVFTLNGFVYGPFHGTRIKEQVYRPDWMEPERVDFTMALADILAQLLPDGVAGSISTSPGAFKSRVDSADHVADMAERYLACATHLADVERRTQKRIALAIEPEPACFLETVDESVAFFGEHLHSKGASERTGLSQDDLRKYLGLCLDTCHAAVEYEAADEALDKLSAANISIAKVQLSSGLRIPTMNWGLFERLGAFADNVYLHQVIQRTEDAVTRYVDLPEALSAWADEPVPGAEWRIHYHVPIFSETQGRFESTQSFLRDVLERHRQTPVSNHLEVETYTWDVLPAALRDSSVDVAISKEIEWVMEQLS